jgi:cholesterol oxidase
VSSEQVHDAVVVGSGFGGSITAHRLAAAGRSVLVLERGRRWAPGQFPRDVGNTDHLLWRYPRHPSARGLFQLHVFDPLAVVTASGVGGGSLIYANVHIRPDQSVFDDPRWPAGTSRATLDPYYDRVAATVGIAPVPASVELPKRDAFHAAAQRMGRPVFDPDEAVSWTQPAQSDRHACELRTECEFGCQVGAKNSLDHTYLALAEAAGAVVRPESEVTAVEQVADGYRVRWRSTATGETHSAVGRRAVIAAGTLGTNRLLLRSRDAAGGLPRLSHMLGHGFSANGDFLGSVQNATVPLEPWRGPDVTSVIRFDEGDVQFTMAAPSFNRAVMAALASVGQPSLSWARPLGPLLWRLFEPAVPLLLRQEKARRPARALTGRGTDPARMTNLFAIGRDDAGGRLGLRGGELALDWDYRHRNAVLIAAMQRAMAAVAAEYGGSFAPIVTWNLFRRIITVHPLGGCRIATGTDSGVVDEHGEVFGHPGLFVADGALLPTSIGYHPCMTIAALAERVGDAVAG